MSSLIGAAMIDVADDVDAGTLADDDDPEEEAAAASLDVEPVLVPVVAGRVLPPPAPMRESAIELSAEEAAAAISSARV